jgi:uncharacterized membrane protein
MSLATFVLVHTVISIVAIVAGIVVMFGMLSSKRPGGLTALFLLLTILTSATGFLIPPLVSDKLLLIACIALYAVKLSGAWRWIYAVTALLALYFNCFVLVIQSFLKIPALTAIAPGNPPSGPVFAVVQGVVLVFFVLMIIGAVRRFRPA